MVELGPGEKLEILLRMKTDAHFGEYFIKIIDTDKFETLSTVRYVNDNGTIHFEEP